MEKYRIFGKKLGATYAEFFSPIIYTKFYTFIKLTWREGPLFGAISLKLSLKCKAHGGLKLG